MTDPRNPEVSSLYQAQEMLPQQPETITIHMETVVVPTDNFLADADSCKRLLGIGFDASLMAIVYPGIHTEDVGAIAVFKLENEHDDRRVLPLVDNDADEHTNVYRITDGLPYVAISQEALDDIKRLTERRGSATYVVGDVKPFGLGSELSVGRGIGQFGSDELANMRETSRVHVTLDSAPNGDLIIIDHSTNGSTVISSGARRV